jgi:putative ATP-binding cassette transporter
MIQIFVRERYMLKWRECMTDNFINKLIGTSFDHVHESSSWFISSYATLSLFKAVVGRLGQFSDSLDFWTASCEKKEIKIRRGGKSIKIEDLRLDLPCGSSLLKIDKMDIKGQSYLIEGKSGVGKTTFFKALSGLWILGGGKITLPHKKSTLFISQKSYMPIGQLKLCFTYPATELREPKKLKDLMKIVGLERLVHRLEEEEEWGHVLSLGEQQKVAILRAILIKPDIIFLDEATSAIDRKSKDTIYNLLKSKLKNTKIISIGHERYLRNFHEELISITDEGIEIIRINQR